MKSSGLPVAALGHGQAAHSRYQVETGIERGDVLDIVVQHDGRVDRVTNPDAAPAADHLFRTIRVGQGNRINHRAQQYEEIVNLARKVKPLQRGVPIKNLLEDFGACAGFDLNCA